jgi:hypothetical protein
MDNAVIEVVLIASSDLTFPQIRTFFTAQCASKETLNAIAIQCKRPRLELLPLKNWVSQSSTD